jgi:signal transduction histidine kinase
VTDTTAPTINKVAILSQSFSGLSDEELEDMARVTRAGTYPPGHYLCREGAHEETFYIIASGEAIITKHISELEGERELRKVGWGDFVGEMALIQNAPRAASVRTLTECAVLEMDKANFEAMLSRSPHMALSIIRTTLNRMRQNDQVAIQDLRRTNQILAQLDRNKLEFIQVAAHELRTPLTVMKGYINVMKLDNAVRSNAMLMEVLDGLNKGTDRLHEIVNTMLDVTRIDSDKLRLAPVPVPLKSVINDIVHRVEKEAAGRNLTVAVDHDPETPLINADPTLIQKAVYHIILNAFKYTPDGGTITVSTGPVHLDKDTPGAQISVQDTGIGLDAEHHELVFEKFYQVGSVALHSSGKTAFKGGGPGLGLAIAKGVARAHGGKLWVESEGHDEEKFPGSTFFFQLPVNPPAMPSNGSPRGTGPLAR